MELVKAIIIIKAETREDVDHIIEDIEFKHSIDGQDVTIEEPDMFNWPSSI